MNFLNYLHYLFVRYMPLVMSAYCVSLGIYYLFINTNYTVDDIKEVFLINMFVSGLGWVLLFLAEENLRRLVSAVQSLVSNITDVLNEERDEDRN